MLVTPEAADSRAFTAFLNRQRVLGQLDRIVVDECHNLLDANKHFRLSFFALKDLLRLKT